jgi:glycosyltransferase involved in cell wall biosynthesis
MIMLTRDAGMTLVANPVDVRPYYDRARAVVVPIRSGGGIRVKILEALAARRPLVTTSIGAEGLPLTPGEHALFADDAEELAEALARVLSDHLLAERLAANGRSLVEREFRWELLASKQERAFRVVE